MYINKLYSISSNKTIIKLANNGVGNPVFNYNSKSYHNCEYIWLNFNDGKLSV